MPVGSKSTASQPSIQPASYLAQLVGEAAEIVAHEGLGVSVVDQPGGLPVHQAAAQPHVARELQEARQPLVPVLREGRCGAAGGAE